jgi:nondiscriminating aspartyl-tRNA synthetase
MAATTVQRTLVQALSQMLEQEVLIRGWVYRLRVLAQTTFIILRDCSGEAQCVAASEALKELHLKLDDAVEIHGRVRADSRAQSGYEVDVIRAGVLNRAATSLPFNASFNLGSVGPEVLLEYRPLAVRNDTVGHVFRVQAALLKYFREYLSDNRFTEIITSKIVASGTEGGTHVFALRYFDRVAYLAQSPQFYKEQGVAGFERVYETGHVYRAEPHARWPTVPPCGSQTAACSPFSARRRPHSHSAHGSPHAARGAPRAGARYAPGSLRRDATDGTIAEIGRQ